MTILDKLKKIRIEANSYREMLVEQQYLPLYHIIKPNTTLFDFGSFNGDSSFYFAMNPNIIEVIGYEKDSKFFDMAMTSREACVLSSKISFINYEVINFDMLSGHERIAIKCDIEGDEHQLFKNFSPLLKNVYAIMLEYHDGYRDIKKSLEKQGFKVEVIKKKPRYGLFETVGFVIANR